MRPLFLLMFVSVMLAHAAIGQSFEVPRDFDPKKTTNYAKYNKDVINCVNWLENTPVTKNPEKERTPTVSL